MSEVDAIIVGIIQGLTEFLPISSSGHIEIARYFLNSNLLPAENLLLTIFLHLATALSTIIIFKKDIIDLISGALNFNNNSLSYILKILISIIPAGLIGFFLNDYIKKFFSGNIKLGSVGEYEFKAIRSKTPIIDIKTPKISINLLIVN